MPMFDQQRDPERSIYRQIDSMFDIQAVSTNEGIVIISANAKGRRIVEDLWPDIEWYTTAAFAAEHLAAADADSGHAAATRLRTNCPSGLC
jgi:hypothetical protein